MRGLRFSFQWGLSILNESLSCTHSVPSSSSLISEAYEQFYSGCPGVRWENELPLVAATQKAFVCRISVVAELPLDRTPQGEQVANAAVSVIGSKAFPSVLR